MGHRHIDEAIGEAVAAATADAGLSERGAAKAFGIPRTAYQRKVRGTSSFSAAELVRIATLLGIDEGAAAFLPNGGLAA